MSAGFSTEEEQAGREIVTQIAQKGGFTIRDDAWKAFAAQYRVENGGRPIANNPYNLTDPGSAFTWKAFGQIGWREGGSASEWHSDFAAFDTMTGGIDAAAQNYLGSYYPDVISSLKRGDDPVAVARAIETSPWSSDHYGMTTLETIVATADGGTVAAPLNSPLATTVEPTIVDPPMPDFTSHALPTFSLPKIGNPIASVVSNVEGAAIGKLVWIVVLGLVIVLVLAAVTES